MTSVLLTTPAWAPHADVIEPRRVRLRDRVQARLRANRLDRALAEGVPPERSVALALRARRLVDPALASTLARAIQRVLRDAWEPDAMPARMPTRSDAVRNAGAELDELARRLVAPHPPAVRGIALVNLLVTDGTGPLYSGDGSASLVSAVRRARAALELV
jgi:hypothetical protein